MNRHDSSHSEACRLARYAARARAAGDTQAAQRFETRALSLVGHEPQKASPVRVLGRRVAVVVAALAVSLPSLAMAAGPKKPQVCAAYEITELKDSKLLGVCLDGKRAKVFVSWKLVDVADPETGAVSRFMVGF